MRFEELRPTGLAEENQKHPLLNIHAAEKRKPAHPASGAAGNCEVVPASWLVCWFRRYNRSHHRIVLASHGSSCLSRASLWRRYTTRNLRREERRLFCAESSRRATRIRWLYDEPDAIPHQGQPHRSADTAEQQFVDEIDSGNVGELPGHLHELVLDCIA